MMKLLHQRALKGLFTLGLFLTAMVSWGQAYTLTWTNGSAAPTAPTGIQITQNYTGHVPGSACNTASNGSTAFTTTIKAATGYNFTITSINGVAARSSAGCQNFQVQLVNNGTLDGAVINVPASSSCGGNTAITIGTIPSANQTVLSGSSATVNVLRTTGCTGYAHTKTFTISGVVTSANSNISDIIRTATATFNEPANIDYKLYQATDITASNSIEVGSFDIRDGAGTTDTDALGTTLTAVSFTVTNASQLRRLALYHFNGSAWVEVGTEQAAAATVTFTGLSGLVAADGATKNFRLRATFAATVTDKTQFSFAISAATADSAGSTFTAATTNGTIKTLNTVNGTQTGNRIEVTADRLAFGTQPAANTNVNTAMANVTVKAIDANNNTDTDFTGTVTLASTGTLSTSPSVNAVSGTATFSGLTHTVGGTGLKYTAAYSTNSWSVDSNTFNINKLAQTISNFTANITKTYGDADFTLGATASSGLDVVYTSSDESVATVTDNTVTILKNGSITITATQPGNGVYSAATSVPRTLTVSKKQLAVTGAVAQSKVYDGSVDAVITGATLTGGVVGSDDVTLDPFYIAEFNNKNIGTAKPVESAFQLAGAQSDRYNLTDPSGLTADITAKELTITGITIADKDFDSDTDATILGTPILNGVVGSEDVTLNTSAAIAVFDNIGPDATIPVTVSGYAINGADIANYTLTQPQGLTANINETGLANQTITFGELDAVTYGDAAFNLNATASSGLTVTYTSSDDNVATVSGNTVIITGSGSATITAYQEGNGTYNPASAVAQGLIVNKKTITVTDAAITDKVYDKTTSAIATGTLSGLVGGDAAFVDLTGTGVFASDDVANGIVVTTNYAISGTRAYNYILTQPGDQTGNITPAELTLAAATAANKIYDGTNPAVVSGTLTGIFAGDTVTYNGTGTFATVDVATGIEVTSTATLTGADAGNYYLTQPTSLTADITVKTITVTATAENKEYNRTTDAVITVSAVNGLADGDDVTAIGGGTFNNFNVGTGKPVTTALTLTGDDAANYTLTQPTGLTADITAKNLTVTSADVMDRAYNGTTNATIENAVLDGIIAGDEAAVTIVAGTFAQAAPGTDIAVSNLVLSGTAAGNYTLTQPEGLTGDITGTVITLSGAAAQNKIYNGTTDAIITGTLTGVAPGDIVTFTGTGTFASKDVSNGIEVTPSITLGGEDAIYYTLTQPTGLTANITPKALIVTATAENKVYDRTTAAEITVSAINGIVDGDDIEVTGGGNFNNLNAGTAKPVTGALVLGGDSVANYTLTQPTGLTADVTKVNLTVVSADVVDRAYNGTTNATIANAILDGIVAGDEAAVTIVAGTFAQATPGTDIAVSNLVLSGTAAANYTLTQPEGLMGDITGSTLTLASAAAQNKIYDGTTAATITGTLSGVAPGDIVTFTGTGTFASEDVANGIEVTPTITLGGEDAMYYTLIQPTGLTANITKKTLTISGLTADNKVYNKTTTATLSGNAVLVGVLNNDDVSLDGIPVANFNNFNVGTSKPVTVTGYVLADDASNYILAQPTGLTANITAKPLTLSGGAVTTKTYNATTSATVTGTLVGVESGDVVTANTGTFASANAGTQNVTVLLTGANAANYTLTQPNPLLTGTINKAALTVTADNKSKTFNTANPALTVSYSGFAGSDNAVDDADFTPATVTTTAVTGSAVGAYPITFATTGDAMNYNMTYVNGTLLVNQSATTQTVLSWDFTGEANGNTSTAEVINSSLAVNGVLSRGADAAASAGSNSFRTVGFQNNGISTTNTDYFQFSISSVTGKLLNLKNLNAQFGGTATFSAGPNGVSGQFAYSLNGTTFTLIGSPFVLTGDFSSSVATMPQIDLSGITGLQNVPATTTVTFRFYASGQTATGGWGFKSPSSGSAGLSVGAAFTDEAKLPVISNITNNSTTVTTTYGTATSFDANVNADATPTVTFSAVFPTGVNGKASIDPATGIITFNDDIDASATPYSISVNSKSYFNTVTNPATNGDTKVLKLKVNKKNQDITFDTTPSPLPDNMQPGYVFTVESNVAEGLPVATWASTNTGVATVADNGDGTATVTIVAAGSANITASNAGNGNYNVFNATAVSVNITTLTATPATIGLVGYNGQPTVAVGLDNITAGNLSPASGNLSVTVTDGTDYFEVSNTAGLGFDAAFAYAYTSASFNTNNPAIYVRLKEGLAIGSYTGTITISGGGAATTVTLNGAVQDAPILTTSGAAYGPYCEGSENNISVDFTTEGDLPAGSFYVQVSDAVGNFPPGFTNIISAASAASPITATLGDDLAAGNYRVRVVHYSDGSLLTASMANNGSDIVINAKPTLTGVQVAVNCAGAASEVSLTGLIPETAFSIDYTIGAGAHTATVTSDAGGNASFEVTLDGINDGQLLTVTSVTRTDITPSCPAAFTVSTTIVIGANTWTGAAGTSDWNDSNNWSCGEVPTQYIRAIIAAGASQPEITDNDTVAVASLTIEDGAEMIVRSGSNISVTNAVVVAEGGMFTLENNANLIQVNDIDNTGDITVIKNSAPMFRLDYALWSSPVTGGSLVDFSPLTLSNRFYHYNPLSDAYAPIPGTTLFEEGSGYLIRVANNHPAYAAGQLGTPWTGNFEGIPNNGDVNVSVMPADGTINGYNAVGNPYPSPINIAAFYAANANNLGDDTSLYFWRKKNDDATSCYASLTLTGYTANNGNAFGDSSNGVFNNPEESDTWVINPGQGFIVQADGNTIAFNNEMRVAVNNNQQFRNAQDEANTGSRLWLNITGAPGEFHQALVAYTNNTTLGLDYGWDGKALTDGTVAIYSLTGASKLGIQARPAFDAADVVPMGYKATTAGSYTITLDHMDGVFSQDQNVYLKDNLFGTTHNLKLSAYEFATDAGTFEGRFEVVYAEALGTDIPAMNANSIIVYKQGSSINISSGTTDMTGVTVYDLRGRMLYSQDGINAAETVISGLQAQEQMLIVEVTTLKGKVSKKIIF